jgi:hypothetical protein
LCLFLGALVCVFEIHAPVSRVVLHARVAA